MIIILVYLVVDWIPFSLSGGKKKHTEWTSDQKHQGFCDHHEPLEIRALSRTHSSWSAAWHDLRDAFGCIVLLSDAKHLLNLSSSDHTDGYRATQTNRSCQSIHWPSHNDHHCNLQSCHATWCLFKQAMAKCASKQIPLLSSKLSFLKTTRMKMYEK